MPSLALLLAALKLVVVAPGVVEETSMPLPPDFLKVLPWMVIAEAVPGTAMPLKFALVTMLLVTAMPLELPPMKIADPPLGFTLPFTMVLWSRVGLVTRWKKEWACLAW